MLWSEFIAELDDVRVECRARHKVTDTVPTECEEVNTLLNLLASVGEETVKPAPKPAPAIEIVDGDLAACAPEEEAAQQPTVIEVVERGAGEGRMLVMAREKPFVPGPVVIEEVTEAELGK